MKKIGGFKCIVGYCIDSPTKVSNELSRLVTSYSTCFNCDRYIIITTTTSVVYVVYDNVMPKSPTLCTDTRAITAVGRRFYRTSPRTRSLRRRTRGRGTCQSHRQGLEVVRLQRHPHRPPLGADRRSLPVGGRSIDDLIFKNILLAYLTKVIRFVALHALWHVDGLA